MLRVFGTSRRSARAAYVRRLKGWIHEEWVGEEPGCLPWWRLGRPPKGEDDDLETAVRARRGREESGPDWRPSLEARQFITRGAGWLGLEISDLRSRRRAKELVRGRELLMVLGVERYGLKVKDLARELQKSPAGMTQTVARATRRRIENGEFRVDLDKLDRYVAEEEKQGRITIAE